MLRGHEQAFSNLQKFSDAIAVAIIWSISYVIRFTYLPNAQEGLALLFLQLAPLIMLLTLYFFYQNNLYRSQRFASRYQEILAVCRANLGANLTFVILIYFVTPERVSRLLLGLYFILSTFGLILLRIIARNYLRALRKKGRNLRHVLLVGDGPQLAQYIQAAKDFKDAGLNFIGWVEAVPNLAQEFQINQIPMSLEQAKLQYNPDVIVLGYAGKDGPKVDQILKTHINDLVPIQVVPDLTYAFIGHQIEDFAGVPLLTVNQPKFNTFELLIKRCFDLSLSVIGTLIISPMLILIAVLIKLTSKGPIFFGQERVGLDGQKFTMWKFRSMKVISKEEEQVAWTTKDDPRKTKLGTLLRKTSIDELPQLWNVICGDMSLVGPRPERPYFVDKFRQEIPAYMLRHKMKAGITGWAQVNGWRGDTSLHKRIECDIYYIKHWSLWFDMKILFLTFWKGFINKNAY